jgi:hypothetical protein
VKCAFATSAIGGATWTCAVATLWAGYPHRAERETARDWSTRPMPERCSLSPDCLRVLREPAASAALSVNLESLRSEQVFSGIRRTNVRTHPRTHKSRAPSSRAEYSPRTSECQRIRIEIRRTARKRERLNRFVTRRDAFRGEAECQESLRLPERERERERARVRERESERARERETVDSCRRSA